MTPALTPWLGRSDTRGAAALARDWFGIVGLIALQHTVLPVWMLPATLVGIAHLQFALGESLAHEAAHGLLFRTRALNRWVAPLVAWPFGFTLADYRREHLHHHRRLGQPDDHIAVAYARHGLREPGQDPPDPPLDRRTAAWVWVGRVLTGAVAWDHLRSLRDLVARPHAETAGLALSWAAVAGIAVATGTGATFVLYWLLPLTFGFSALLYWSEVGDHFAVPEGDTRTRTGRLSNWLHHHNGLHALHHRYPAIPFFRLPAAYAALRGTFPETVSRGWWHTWSQIAGLDAPATAQERPEDARASA